MTPADAALVSAAGLLAGAINAVAGGGTLISFPALLAAGLPPVTANITSSVGLLAGYLGGSVAYRRELAGQRARVRLLLPAAAIGAVLGAILLLLTPQDAFRTAVPYLVLASCLLLALQPRLARALARRPRASELPVPALLAVGLASVYGSYFGAGLGVLLLAILGVLLTEDLQRLNALKGLLSLLVNIVGVVVFLLATHVAWAYVGLLSVSAYVGATFGVGLARRLPAAGLRAAVITLGVIVAVVLLIK